MLYQPPFRHDGGRPVQQKTGRHPIRGHLLALLLIMAWTTGQAQDPAAFTDFGGHLSAGYLHTFGSGESTGPGVSFGVGLSFGFSGLDWGVSADRIDLTSPNVSVTASNSRYSGSFSFAGDTRDGSDTGRNGDFSVRNTLRLDGLPGVSLSVGHRASPGSSRLSLGTNISDSYRNVSPAIRNLNWQFAYSLNRSAREGHETLLRHTAQARVGATITEEGRPEVEFRPGFRVRSSWGNGEVPELKQRYDLSLGARSRDGQESVGLDLELGSEQDGATEIGQKLAYTTSRLGPFDLSGEVAFGQKPAGIQGDYRLGLTFDIGDGLQASGGYHGRSGPDRASHGVEASVQYRLNARPWHVSARADGDLQFLLVGGVDPSSRLSMSMRYGGDPITASATGYLRYHRGLLSGRAQAGVDYEREGTALGLAGGLQLARDLTADLMLSGRTRIAGAWSLQGEAGYEAGFADETEQTITLGLGLRYDFGGQR